MVITLCHKPKNGCESEEPPLQLPLRNHPTGAGVQTITGFNHQTLRDCEHRCFWVQILFGILQV
jgi:hypothetical protein